MRSFFRFISRINFGFLKRLKESGQNFQINIQMTIFYFAKVFLLVNVGKHRKVAETLNINTTVLSRQLPTVILFKNFEEIRRFPPINEEGLIAKVLRFDGEQLEKFFEFKRIRMMIVFQKKQWEIEND